MDNKVGLIKKAIIVSTIYDIVVLAMLRFRSKLLGVFFLILGLINLFFIIKAYKFQFLDEDERQRKSKIYKIIALVIQAVNAFTWFTFVTYIRQMNRLNDPEALLFCMGLSIKLCIMIFVMDNTADELKIKWKNKRKGK